MVETVLPPCIGQKVMDPPAGFMPWVGHWSDGGPETTLSLHYS